MMPNLAVPGTPPIQPRPMGPVSPVAPPPPPSALRMTPQGMSGQQQPGGPVPFPTVPQAPGMQGEMMSSGGPVGGMAKSAIFQSMLMGDPYGMYGAPNNGILGPALQQLMGQMQPKQNALIAPKSPTVGQGFTTRGNGGDNTDYRSVAQTYANQYGVPPDLFERQINQESGFNPNAISPAGAIGVAQFMPGTAQGLGINPYDPNQSLQGAASLMKSYYDKYGSWALALIAYNAGGGVADQVAAGNANALPDETQRYLTDILGSYT